LWVSDAGAQRLARARGRLDWSTGAAAAPIDLASALSQRARHAAVRRYVADRRLRKIARRARTARFAHGARRAESRRFAEVVRARHRAVSQLSECARAGGAAREAVARSGGAGERNPLRSRYAVAFAIVHDRCCESP